MMANSPSNNREMVIVKMVMMEENRVRLNPEIPSLNEYSIVMVFTKVVRLYLETVKTVYNLDYLFF